MSATTASTATVTAAPEGLHEPYAAWRTAALADGWTETPGGPWGHQAQPFRIDPATGAGVQTGERSDGDRSIALRKDDMRVILADRDDNTRYAAGWFRNGLQAWAAVPAAYDAALIDNLRTRCTFCGTETNPNWLVPMGFAGRACPDCNTPERRAQAEPQGWTN